MNQLKKYLLICLALLSVDSIYGQYQVNGNASSTGSGCYQLTPNATGQVGSVWNTNLINLNNAFDFTFNVFLGCDDAGADGICFGLQPLSTTIGISGNGMGLGTVSPSLGVYIDTYQNSLPDFDPAYDHISLNANGDVDHSTTNNLAGPVQASSTNADIEDCANHTLRVQWNPITQTYQVWFDGVLRLTYVGDIINNIFGGNPNVYWGFTGSTGGLTNQQSFCIIIAANFSANIVCIGSSTNFTDLSTSGTPITSWTWDFGDGSPLFSGSVAATYQNPNHSYAAAGVYDVTETITNSVGGTSTISHNVTVLAPPTVTASGGTTICAGQSVNLTGTVGGPSNTPVTFSSSSLVLIPDGGVSFGWTGTGSSYGTSNISVTGLNTGWTFTSVSLNITHTWDSDVIVYLFNPCGNSIQLISGNGGSGDNFTNTVFSSTAATNISSGAAPFNGTFVPAGGTAAWNAFITASQGCASANGTWSIHIGDYVTPDGGALTGWSLNFSNPTSPTYTWAPTTNMSNSTTLNPTVTPTVTTTYTLTASNSYGCTSTATTVVTIGSALTVTVNSATICTGQTASLTASGGTTYVWSNASTKNPLTVTPATTSTYTVTGTASGCTGTATAKVTIASGLSITVNSSTVCSGQLASLTASGGTTYVWSNASTTNPLNVTPVSTSTYTVTGTTTGCTGSATAKVTVNAVPTISVNSTTICAGQSTTLTASGGTTYVWSNASTINPLSITPASTTTFTVIGTTTGCTGSATAKVTVNIVPTISVNSTTICAGQSTTLTASGGTTYVWSNASTINPLSITPSSTTTFTVTGTTTGCTGSATAKVTVNTVPTISVNSTTICAGQSTTLTASGGTTYVWSNASTINPLNVTPASTSTFTVTGTTSGCTGSATAKVTISPALVVSVNSPTICFGQSTFLTASGGTTYVWSNASTTNPLNVTPASTSTFTVTGTTTGCTGSATAKVTVASALAITVNASTICSGQTASLTASGGTTYVWSNASTLNPLNITPVSTSTYTVTGTTSGCTGSATAQVSVNALPTISLNSATVCAGTSTCITASGASTYVWSDASVANPLCVTPASTSTYTVTGTTTGCTASNKVTVTVNSLPIISSSSSTICLGQTASLTASGGTTYIWSNTSTSNPLSVTPVSASTYTVTGTLNGCTGSAIATITIAGTLVLTANSTTICSGQATSITANGGASYVWSNASISNPLTVTPVSTSTYTVTGTAGGCTGTATASVTVNSIPTITVSSATVCNGTSATLSANGGTNYVWSNFATTASISVNPSNNSTYTVVGTNLGCTNFATASVTVNTAPIVIANSVSICAGDDANLTANGAASYSWSTADVTNSITVTPINTSSYTVTGTTLGCTNSALAIVTVNSSPTISVNSSTICKGNSTNLNATGGTIYAWSTTETNSTISVAPTINTTYTVTGTTSGCSASATTFVVVNSLPTVSFNADITSGCKPVCVNFTDVSSTSVGDNIANWNWDFGGDGISSSQNPTHCFNNAGQYSITLTVQSTTGCTSTFTNNNMINVYDYPVANFSSNPNPATVGDPVITFSNESSNDVVYWNWNFGDGDTLAPTTANPTHTYPADIATTYPVTLIVQNVHGCTSTIEKDIVINQEFVFYIPNAFSPNGDGKNDLFFAVGSGIILYNIFIFDRWGDMIFSSDDITKTWDGKANGGSTVSQEDVYVWKVNLTDVFNKKHNYTGTVTIVK